jgi:putative transcriptional regulator
MKKKLTKITLQKGVTPKRDKTNFTRLKTMTDEEIERNALLDEDNSPLTKAQLAQFRPAKIVEEIDIKAIRERLGYSQEKFAQYFGVNVRTLQDWEQHRHKPNRTAINFLRVVAKEPEAVQRALG